MPLLLLLLLSSPAAAAAACSSGCPLALGSYYISPPNDIGGIALNLTFIASLFNTTYPALQPYNPTLPNVNNIVTGTSINVFFPCACVDNDYLAATFPYPSTGTTYDTVARNVYANLTTADWLQKVNGYGPNKIPDSVNLKVPVNCSCGDVVVDRGYGLFETYPLREGDSLAKVAAKFNFSGKEDLLQRYNAGVDFGKGTGIVFVPVRDLNGSYLPFPQPKSGIPIGAIAGIVVVVVVLLMLALYLYFGVYRRKKKRSTSLLHSTPYGQSTSYEHDASLDRADVPLAGVTSYTVDRSVEFSYDELAKATDDFSMANKIGEGGFGAVYYAELRGEKAAIKKMDLQATKEFLAELKVLTHVHHRNLVRLIGYCTEGSLFIVYEYIENGNLSQHLRGPGRDPLSWSSRVQIALDSARGLEYIHEHTVPVYIHRDIKSANILIDKDFHAKVADFGLTKLTEVGSTATKLVGTFGYMPPEYAQYGEATPKVDVFAFGVVLYELISAKDAIIRGDSVADSKGLVVHFEESLKNPDKKEEELRKIVDPRLGDNYPVESVYKLAQLAKACTQENPQLRPAMRSIVVALMTLSSSTDEWDLGSFYENQALVNMMSGR